MSADHEPLQDLIASAKAQGELPPGQLDEAWIRFEGTVSAGGAPVVDVGVPDPGAAGATAAGGTLLAKGLVVSGLCVLGVATAVAVWSPPSDPEDPPPTTSAKVVDGDKPPAAAPEEPPVADPVEPPPPDPPPTPRTERSPSAKQPSASKAPAATPATLAEQAQLLGRAWAQAGDGHNAAALALVAEHRRRYPRSVLAPERSACELVAKCQRGDKGAGRRAAKFVAGHSGTLAKRVADSCREAIERVGERKKPARRP